MRPINMKNAFLKIRLLLAAMVAVALLTATAHAAAPGITGTGAAGTFNLTAQTAFLNQPDGAGGYAWGYGCTTGAATVLPAAVAPARRPNMPSSRPPPALTEE